jgi:pimeloyl-ACP methyl ester carboxylesterase
MLSQNRPNRRIIYLHGFASSPASRKARFFAEKFAACGVPFLAPSLDQGNFPAMTISVEMQVVQDLLREAPEPAILMGSSLGGYVASLIAARQPAAVERLILLAPAFRLYQRWCEQLPEGALERWRDEKKMMVYHYGDQMERPIHYEFLRDAEQYEAFPDVRQPTLVLHGIDDPVVPVSYSEEFVAARQEARLVKLKSGHELTDTLDILWRETQAFSCISGVPSEC